MQFLYTQWPITCKHNYVKQVIPINKVSDTIGSSFIEYVDYASYTVHPVDKTDQSGECGQVTAMHSWQSL